MEIEALAIRSATNGDADTLKRLLQNTTYRPYLANNEIRKKLYQLGRHRPEILSVLQTQNKGEINLSKAHYASKEKRAEKRSEVKT